ncbi:GNAT family N-acetyltransferase [Deinococcus fonticola]|uniref:GNAT family N-acetyltransferase n=1 Tax=Deinococcus fonticola TaxID=2528713 RepID=UPI0010755A63|nr:GNAT family N-acetyltransferase [Deinococcus fonticola]
MTHLAAPAIRTAEARDAYLAALLHNATQEPHFRRTAEQLAQTFSKAGHGYVISETAGWIIGLASLWLPDFHPTHAWVSLSLHPDHLADDTARQLLISQQEAARAAGRPHLWLSVREDYLPHLPDLSALGFREVHRTFGGGFHLNTWQASTRQLDTSLQERGYTLTPAQKFQDDPRLQALYDLTRNDKISAAPTIPEASDTLADGDALWNAAWLAWHGETLVGLALPEKGRLDAWNAVLIVHPQHRRRGLATALLAQVARTLQSQGITFLNTAGSQRDAAYLGVLRRLGANIEPDWIAWELEA